MSDLLIFYFFTLEGTIFHEECYFKIINRLLTSSKIHILLGFKVIGIIKSSSFKELEIKTLGLNSRSGTF